MKRYTYFAGFLVAFFAVLIVVCCSLYKYNISPVSNKSDLLQFEIEEGETYLSIAPKLKEKNLIRSEFFYKLYVKLMNPSGMQHGSYYLSENMGVEKIVKTLSNKSDNTVETISITFKEGKNMRAIAKIIADNTSITEEQVFAKLKDSTYIDSLISKYWFLTDEIKNPSIYYPLEGYLFPDTYQFYKDATIEDIFKTMLDEFEKKIEPYKSTFIDNNYPVHPFITLASVVELEGSNSGDRAGVAGVFYNRMNAGWSLGSDVTTYYASGVDMSERDLYKSELDECNAYNTRATCMAGKLPVGPICNPSIESIEAVLNPKSHDYFYFVADKNKQTYFTKTFNEHQSTIKTLKDQGLWFEY